MVEHELRARIRAEPGASIQINRHLIPDCGGQNRHVAPGVDGQVSRMKHLALERRQFSLLTQSHLSHKANNVRENVILVILYHVTKCSNALRLLNYLQCT